MKTIIFALLLSVSMTASANVRPMPQIPSDIPVTIDHCVGLGNATMALSQRVISGKDLNAEHEYIISHKEMPQWLKDVNLWMQEIALMGGLGSSSKRGTIAMVECLAQVPGISE